MEQTGGRDGNRDRDKSSLFRRDEREREREAKSRGGEEERARFGGEWKTGRESERVGNIAKKIDDGKGW